MAGSCAYCGTPLDQNGLCPNCGNENETTGLLTPEETPAFYTQAQGQSPAPGGHAPAYPAPGPAAPAYPQAAPGPVAPAYHKAAPGPAAPPKPKKNGGGKKIALAVGVAVLFVGLVIGLLFVLGVIRLPEKGDPLAEEIYFLVTPAEHIQTDEKNGTLYADNELLVVARPGVKKREMETVAARHNATVVGCIEMTGDYQLRLETPMSPEELDRRALAIASEPEIESAARNTVIRLRKAVPASNAPQQAADASPTTDAAAYWNLRLIRAPEAWDVANAHTDEIRPVAVGMIADGAPADHPDIPLTQRFFTANGDASHALAVAGIMAADGTNEDGFSGVYPFARDRFYAASAEGMGSDGVSVMWEKAALAKLIVSGAKVLNCGYTAADEADVTAAADTLGDYLDRTLQAGYDFLIVTASVNGEDAEYSAALNAIDGDQYPDVFARILVTGGADKNGLPFDGAGVEADARLDLLAPLGRGTPLYTTLPGGYGYAPDWSDLCAPHVSGAAALVWSADHSLTGDAVKRILLRTAQANALLDVNAAVTYALEHRDEGKTEPPAADDAAEAVPELARIWYLLKTIETTFYNQKTTRREETFNERGEQISLQTGDENSKVVLDDLGRIVDMESSLCRYEVTAVPDENGSHVIIEYDMKDPEIHMEETVYYDSRGRQIKSSSHRDDEPYTNETEFSYYENGMKKSALTMEYDGNGEIHDTTEVVYDPLFGHMLSRVHVDANGFRTENAYTYRNGVLIGEQETLNGDVRSMWGIQEETAKTLKVFQTKGYRAGAFIFTYEFELDEAGRIVRKTTYEDSVQKSVTQYEYTQNGLLEKETETSSNGKQYVKEYVWARRSSADSPTGNG